MAQTTPSLQRHLPDDIIQSAIRMDTGVGDSRLEVAMIWLSSPVITTRSPSETTSTSTLMPSWLRSLRTGRSGSTTAGMEGRP